MPNPHVIEIAIEAKSKADQGKLVSALDKLAANDPLFEVLSDAESGQVVVKGVSELQLDTHIAALNQTFALDVKVGAPQVAYRETLTRRVEKDYTFKRQFGRSGKFARVKIVLEPSPDNGFESKIAGGAIPDAFISGIATGVDAALRSGILAGFPVVRVKTTLIDGAFHDTDSSVDTFEIAATAACREALREGGSILLEPVMAVTITIPEDYLGFVTGDLHARRGQARGHARRDEAAIVDALVPFANMLGYDSQLRSGTRGRGSYTMGFSHYAPLPPRPDDNGPASPAVALRA